MPVYEYRCEDCGHIFEEWQKTYEDLDLKCPLCKGDSRRVMSNTAFILKGTGWYTTDYARRNGNNIGAHSAGPGPEMAKSVADAQIKSKAASSSSSSSGSSGSGSSSS